MKLTIHRVGRFGLVALLVGVMSGCCVLPWGGGRHHAYGDGGRDRGGPAPRWSQADPPAPGPGWGRPGR